jgi:hypothetical protein
MKRSCLICLILPLLFAQTQLRIDSQVSPLPTVIVAQYATCIGLPSCAGIQYAQFKMSDGTTRGPFWLVPTTPGFALDVNWTSIPVTTPAGTAANCSQVKP